MSVLNMNIPPRPYQPDSVYKLIPDSFRAGHTSVILYSPMRSGKSIEQALMAKGAYEKEKRIILLTHRSKIFSSTFKHLGNAGIPCVDFTAGKKMPAGDWKIMLAMERTLWNVIKKNPDSILQPNLLLVDEIHLNNFSKIMDFFLSRAFVLEKKLYVVAFSGTPKGKHLHKYFTEIIKNVDSSDLVGYDHPPMTWVAVDRATMSITLWLQMATRAATPYPGKTEYTLLDMGMNHIRHGLVH